MALEADANQTLCISFFVVSTDINQHFNIADLLVHIFFHPTCFPAPIWQCSVFFGLILYLKSCNEQQGERTQSEDHLKSPRCDILHWNASVIYYFLNRYSVFPLNIYYKETRPAAYDCLIVLELIVYVCTVALVYEVMANLDSIWGVL